MSIRNFLILLFAIGTSCISFAADPLCNPVLPYKDLGEFVDSAMCAELPVGKSKIVNFEYSESPTTVRHKYELKRVSEDMYKVRLNLNFRENTFFGKENSALTAKMRSKVQKCITQMNPHFLGPDNKRFEIELMDASASKIKKYQAIENVIFVDGVPIERENSGHYSIHTSCSIITHELLHLMGLVDEYQEMHDISMVEQDCRSFGPTDSIMNQQELTVSQSKDANSQSLVTTCCFCKDQSCKKKSNAEIAVLKACPDGYNTTRFYGAGGNACNIAPTGLMTMGMGMSMFPDDAFMLSQKPSGRIKGSYLYPAHFRAIISPGCYKKNANYYACSRDAYHRPYKVIGSCHRKPIQCQGGDAWLQ